MISYRSLLILCWWWKAMVPRFREKNNRFRIARPLDNNFELDERMNYIPPIQQQRFQKTDRKNIIVQTKELLLPEFDIEMANTRKVLERVPDELLNWKPHEKSSTMMRLAIHVASLPRLATIALQTDFLDLRSFPPQPSAGSRREILDLFETVWGAARSAIIQTTEDGFSLPWSLNNGSVTIFTMPRAAVMRRVMLNHLIHHRGQLTVYLRLCNIAVPALYGPSADER